MTRTRIRPFKKRKPRPDLAERNRRPEIRAKVSAALKGRARSEAHCRALSAALVGRINGRGPKVSVAEKIVASSRIDDATGCRVWMMKLDADGYGHLTHERRTRSAHRTAYELAKGPIPEGLTIDHLCRVRHCVNPDHLEAVTVAVNVLRGVGPCALNAQKTHCKRGHAFTAENTVPTGKGGRMCRMCRNTAALAAYHRNKQRAHQVSE